jgi:hypothetical protein
VSVLAHKLHEIYAKLLNPDDFPEFSDHKHSRDFLPYAIAYSKELTAKHGRVRGERERKGGGDSTETQPLNGQQSPLDTLFTLPYWTKVKPCYGLNWRTGEHYITHRHHALFWYGPHNNKPSTYYLMPHS